MIDFDFTFYLIEPHGYLSIMETDDDLEYAVLTEMFNAYLEHGSRGRMNLTKLLNEHEIDSTKFGNELAKREVIQDVQASRGGIIARISMKGIIKVKPTYVSQYRSIITSKLKALDNRPTSIVTVLDFKASDADRAEDLARYFASEGWLVFNNTGGKLLVHLA